MALTENRMSLALAAYRTARAGRVPNGKTLSRIGHKPGKEMNHAQAKAFAKEIVNDAHFKDEMKDVVREVNQWNTRMILEKRLEFRIDLKASVRAREKAKPPPKQMRKMAENIVEAYRQIKTPAF